jgi:hypothetical protein
MKAKAQQAASVNKYIVIGQSCMDVQKSAYDALIKTRLGNNWHIAVISKDLRGQVIPNGWIQLLPTTFNNINTYLHRWKHSENYFTSPPKLKTKVIVEPYVDITPKN